MGELDRSASDSVVRIVIADDHPLVREGIRHIFEEAPDLRVVAEASTGEEAVACAREHQPGVLILDVTMEGPGLLETVHKVKEAAPRSRTLVLSMHREKEYAVRALRAGAWGYLHKHQPPARLVEAVRQVASGERCVAPEVASELARSIAGGDADGLQGRLSDREFQVFCMIGSGRSVKEIGETLALSPKTVSTYRTRTLEKTGMRSNAEIIRYAVQHGLVA